MSAEEARQTMRCAKCGELVRQHRIVAGIVIHPREGPSVTPQEVALADAKVEELKILYDQIGARIKQLQEAKVVAPKPAAELSPKRDNSVEEKLLKLTWSTAKSGSCDYNREVPSGLLAEVRAAADSKGELKGEGFHYVIKADGAILRFRRK